MDDGAVAGGRRMMRWRRSGRRDGVDMIINGSDRDVRAVPGADGAREGELVIGLAMGGAEYQADEFLSALAEVTDEQAAVDYVVNAMDDWLLAGEFAKCDAVIRRIECDGLSSSAIMAVVFVMWPANAHLDHWPVFLPRAKTALEKLTSAAYAEELFRGIT